MNNNHTSKHNYYGFITFIKLAMRLIKLLSQKSLFHINQLSSCRNSLANYIELLIYYLLSVNGLFTSKTLTHLG